MKRFITWLLIASMIFTSTGFTTFADNVNANDVIESVKEATTEVVENFLVSENETENEVANDEVNKDEVASDETANAKLLGEASEEESTIEESDIEATIELSIENETWLELETDEIKDEDNVEPEEDSEETYAETDLETEAESVETGIEETEFIENVETETVTAAHDVDVPETSETIAEEETTETVAKETTSKTWILNKKLYDIFSEHDKIENNTPYPLIFKRGGSAPDGVVDLGIVGTSTDGDDLYGYFNTLNKDVKKLTIWIPGENDDLYLTEDATEIFSNLSINKIQNLDLLNTSKTTNMSHLFENCRDLTSLDLSSFDTSSVIDMSYMFSMGTLGSQLTKASVLNSLDISSFDTKNVENMEAMFQGITKLTKLNIDNFDTTNVTNMSSMFSSLSNVETITFGNSFNTSNVTDMSSMFEYCNNLKTLDVSNFDLSNVKSLKTAFANCYKLKSLDFSNVNMSGVNSFVSTFENCTSLTKVIFSGDSINTVANMQYMFAKCTSLTTVDLSGISIVENTNSMFSNCTSLKTIYVDRDWTLFLNESSANMFNACDNLVGGCGTTFNSNYIDDTYAYIDKGNDRPGYFTLKNVITITFDKNGAIGNEVMENQIANNDGETKLNKNLWTNDGYKFSGWNTAADGTGSHYDDEGTYAIVESITLYAEWTKVEQCDYVLNERFFKTFADKYLYVELLKFVEGGDTPMGDTYEVGHAIDDSSKPLYGYYYGNTEEGLYTLTIRIPEGSTLYAPEDSEELFRNNQVCIIENLNLLNTSKVTNMSYMFWECRELEYVDISSFDVSNVKTLARMFDACRSIKHINFGDNFNSKNVTDYSYMFCGCFNLIDLDLSGLNTSSATDMSRMFLYTHCLQEITFGENFDTSKVRNMAGMFCTTKAIKTLDLTSFDTSACIDTTGMFDSCYELTTIYISDKWNMQNVPSTKSMFSACFHLEGGKGTRYDEVKDVTAEYAHADYGPGYKGYLTLKDLIVVTYFPNDGSDQIFFIAPDKNSSFEVGNNSFTNWGYEFVGWNTKPDGTGISYSETDMIENITSDMNFYAMWTTQVNYMLNEKFMNNLADQNIQVSYLKFVKGGDIPEGDKIEIGHELDGSEKLYGYRNNDNFVVYIPEGATLYAPANASNLFSHGALKDIENLNLLDTSKTTNMSYMFDGSDHLINLDLSGFDVSNVTDMSYMFYACINLQNINFGSNFNTKNVKTFFTMFSDCEDLAKLDLSGWNTASATDMRYMFVNCTGIKEIIFGENFTISKVTSTSAMFSECNSLTKLDFTYFDISALTDASYMFKNCYQLSTIYVSDTWDMKNVKNAYAMFKSCNRLVGGKGTAFDRNKTNGDYAHIDYGTTNKGYLTLKDLVVVTYDKNDGSNELNYSATTIGNNITLNNNFSYEGHTFANWNTKKDGTGTNYNENAEIKNATNDLTLYAIWKESSSTDDKDTTDKDTTIDKDTTDKDTSTDTDKNATDTTNTNTTTNTTTTTTTTTKNYSSGSSGSSSGGGGGGGGSISATNNTNASPLTQTTNTANTTAINTALGNIASKVTNGLWFKADISWKLNVDGSVASNGWYEIKNADNSTSFYKFDTSGNMETGLVSQNGAKYYLDNNATSTTYGSMQFGWQNVNGTNNYFGTDGRLLASGTTPDGYVLDSTGKVVGLASNLKSLGITTTTVNGVVEQLNFDSATPYKEQVAPVVETIKTTATTVWNQVKNLFKGFSF